MKVIKLIGAAGLTVLLAVYMIGCGGGGGGGTTSTGGGTASIHGTVVSLSNLVAATSWPAKNPPDGSTSLQLIGGKYPVPGAVVTLEGTDKSGTTDADGFFQIKDVAKGSYILICKKTVASGDTYAFLQIVEVTSDGQTLDLGVIEITLEGSIQGKATLQGQTDHTGINVYVPGTSLQTTTDATGAYLLKVPAGTYSLYFEKTGYNTKSLTGVTVTAGQVADLGELPLSASLGPTGSISINNGATYAGSMTVNLSITHSSDATLMMISESNTFANASWQTISNTTIYSFTSDGSKRLYIKFSDANGLESAPVSDDIIVDTTPPSTCTLTINSGAAYTNTTSATLGISASDATTSVSQMMVSNYPDFADASWMTFSGTLSWTLLSGDGTKTVYVKCKDVVGNETASASSDTILLDTDRPASPTVSINEGNYTKSTSITLTLSATGAAYMKISEDPSFTAASSIAYATTAPFTLSSGDGSKTVYVKFLDEAGNESAVVSDSIILDTTPPTKPVIFNQEQVTNQTAFTMSLSQDSADTNFKNYQLQGGQYSTWTDVTPDATNPTRFNFTLSTLGANTLQVRGVDWAGNIGTSNSVIITLDTVFPVINNIRVLRTGTTATISWDTNETTTNNTVEYGLNTNYGSLGTDSNSGTSHTVTLTGLSQKTVYHYRISSTDAGNNTTTSTDLTFETGTNVSGNITSNTTWAVAQSPYIIVGNVGVLAGVTLTIEPGVTVEFAGAYTMLIKGSVIANGTSDNRIAFKSQTPGTSSGATVLKFAETNLSNSILNYVTIEDAYEALRVGDESEFNQTNPKNSGTLNATYIEVTRAGITTDGYQTTAKVVLTNATISGGSILGTYPRSEPIEIKYSTITNSTVTSDSYNYGITLVNTTSTGSQFYLGCCGANINFTNSTASSGTLGQGGGSPIAGPIQMTNSQFTNMSIDLPYVSATITNSTFTYNSSYGGPTTRIKLGSGSLASSRITNSGSGVGLRITGYNGYSSGQSFNISSSDITDSATGILCSGNFPFTVSTSNIYSNSTYNVDYRNTQNSTATGNYWGVTTASQVGVLIYDGNDDINYGILDVSTFSTTPIAGTGPQP